MDRKIWTILLSVVLIGCFFLPIIKFGSISAYDVVSSAGKPEHIWDKYLWLLIPLSALILIIGAVNNGTYFLGRSFWTFIPLLTLLYYAINMYLHAKDLNNNVPIGDFIKVFGTGFWAMLGGSVLLAFIHPRGRS